MLTQRGIFEMIFDVCLFVCLFVVVVVVVFFFSNVVQTLAILQMLDNYVS
jgi:hypothetical protein